jgi:hypothetical protein
MRRRKSEACLRVKATQAHASQAARYAPAAINLRLHLRGLVMSKGTALTVSIGREAGLVSTTRCCEHCPSFAAGEHQPHLKTDALA